MMEASGEIGGRKEWLGEPPKLLVVLLIMFAGLFVYSPVFHGDWLWDDDSEVTEHAALHTLPGLIDIWQAQGSPDFLPVKSTVQWVYYRFVGKNPTAWHLLNIGLHLCSALLIWQILGRLGVRYAWIGGLLWAIHPFAVGSVAWISELKNTLSLPFYLLAFLRFLDFYETGRKKDWCLAFVFFAASLLSKSSGVMLPCVLLLFVWWEKAGGREPSWEKVASSRGGRDGGFFSSAISFSKVLLVVSPFFLASLAVGLATIYFQQSRAIGEEELPIGGVFSRVVLSGQAVWFYFSKAVFPFGLLPNYPRWDLANPSLLQLLAWPGLFFLVGLFWFFRSGWGRHALFGFGFFFLNLIPVLGFFRMSYMRITWVSDHLAYLSLVGVVGLVVVFCGWVYDECERGVRPFFCWIGTGLIFLFALSAHQYSAVFTSEEAMWKYTLRGNPEAWQAHSRLARELGKRGHHGVAAYHIAESLRLRPDLPETHHNHGVVLLAKGDVEGAIAQFRYAAGKAPYAEMFRVNLANALCRIGNYQEAEEILMQLKEKRPQHPILLNNIGGVLYQQGRVTEAIRYFKKALEVNPNSPSSRENLEFAMRSQRVLDSSGSQGGIRFIDSEVPLTLSQPHLK